MIVIYIYVVTVLVWFFYSHPVNNENRIKYDKKGIEFGILFQLHCLQSIYNHQLKKIVILFIKDSKYL